MRRLLRPERASQALWGPRFIATCAIAVLILGAFAVAQNSEPDPATALAQLNANQPALAESAAANLPAKATLVAGAVSAPALAVGSQQEILLSALDTPHRVLLTDSNALQSSATDARASKAASTSNAKFAVFAATGIAGFSGDGGAALSAQVDLEQASLYERSGIAVAADGTTYIADTNNATIRSVAGPNSTEPNVIRSIAGKWGPRQNVALSAPMGIAVDAAGNLYIADHGAGAVDMLSAATSELTTIAQVASPASIAVSNDGTKIFVASPESGAVFAIAIGTRAITTVSGFAPAAASTESNSSGPCASVVATAASSSSSQSGKRPALETSEQTTSASSSAKPCPAGLAVDGRGNLFVSDAAKGRILRIDAATSKLTTAASGMLTPGDIAFDRNGDLFVSEQGRDRVLAFADLGDPSNLTLTAPAAFPAPCPQVTNPFTFCTEPQGGTTAQAAFTLTNTSNTTLTGITITPAFVPTNTQPQPPPTNFTNESTSCTATLNPGASCTINMAFTPLSTGPISGTLSVTDNEGDSVSVNLAGTADTFSLQFASGQTTELTVAQGNSVTFMAQVVPDDLFGANGEQVSFSCPANLPIFSTCEFKPCPISITPGTAASFNIVYGTSTETTPAPPVSNPCGGGTSSTARIRRAAGTMIFRVAPPPSNSGGAMRLLAFAALAILAMLGLVLASRGFAFGGRRFRRVPLIFAAAAITAIVLAGCHHSKQIGSSATPTGTYSLTVLGNALDANGNPLNASRSLTMTLDVVQQGTTGSSPF